MSDFNWRELCDKIGIQILRFHGPELPLCSPDYDRQVRANRAAMAGNPGSSSSSNHGISNEGAGSQDGSSSTANQGISSATNQGSGRGAGSQRGTSTANRGISAAANQGSGDGTDSQGSSSAAEGGSIDDSSRGNKDTDGPVLPILDDDEVKTKGAGNRRKRSRQQGRQ